MMNNQLKDRTKNKPTSKKNKWNDPFYYKSKLFKEKQAWIKGSMKQEAVKRGNYGKSN